MISRVRLAIIIIDSKLAGPEARGASTTLFRVELSGAQCPVECMCESETAIAHAIARKLRVHNTVASIMHQLYAISSTQLSEYLTQSRYAGRIYSLARKLLNVG